MSVHRALVFVGTLALFAIPARSQAPRLALVSLPPPPQGVANRLASLGWLAGCWELRSPQRVTLEMWMPPDGNMMLGASRTTAGGAVREFEQLRMAWQGDSLVYTSIPWGQKETSFKTAAVSDSGFSVDNLKHDFPQRIIYRRRGADSLIARIEGPGANGVRGINFPMKRVACTVP